MEVLWAFLILAGIGLIFGFILALSGKIFYVKEDTRASDIKELLPNYNCGACGYPGCSGFANAIVSPAMEFKKEGLVFGVGAKMFYVAGPVIVNGVTFSIIVGLLFLIFGI